ncbi:hypothetical protein G3567_03275 [Psychroflexus sp. YR1-1]|uniref:Right handed beta helix region n=1 Tax=Psychroflexus aurantiacus TaxID=2709310 RepID=A0A6B3QZI7_9FLAO|nr:hypothetical protein [Psychroflexus aurantiacus]NEV93168.1 hypothetical protein [Psychroflexus aurantiacus]
MKHCLIILFVIGLISFTSCRDDFELEPSFGALEFSKDTLYLDTVFTNIGSSTYKFKVYNRSDQDISIPRIQLNEGQESNFRLNVDGVSGKILEDINILAKDSIFVFVEVTADIQDLAQNQLSFLYTDQILFDSGPNMQQVELVTLVQDAYFLFPERFEDGSTETLSLGLDGEGQEIQIDGFILEDEHLTFTNEKPYVIYGFAGVPSGKTLSIQAGARVHFHDNSGIIVSSGASMHALGELSEDPERMENEIIFEGDRLEPEFSEVPGQWAAIWLTQGSTNHRFDHVTVKNSTVGILMDSNDGSDQPTLTIKNTQIYNSANVGLLARTGFIDAENLIINNSGQVSLNLSLGGRYNFRHCTFANYWQNGFRQFPAVLIENNLEAGETLFVSDLVEANFSNCIIYGNESIELIFNKVEEAAFNYKFENCLLRFNDTTNRFADNGLYDFQNTELFENIILNEAPLFLNAEDNHMIISDESPADGQANQAAANRVPFDILGKDRTQNPDLGAYQSIPFEE